MQGNLVHWLLAGCLLLVPLVAVVIAGLGMIGETITCPASGHHHVLGWWWYVQLTLSIAVLLGGLALRRVLEHGERSAGLERQRRPLELIG